MLVDSCICEGIACVCACVRVCKPRPIILYHARLRDRSYPTLCSSAHHLPLIGHTHYVSFRDARRHTHTRTRSHARTQADAPTKGHIDTTVSASSLPVSPGDNEENPPGYVTDAHARADIYACTLSCPYTHTLLSIWTTVTQGPTHTHTDTHTHARKRTHKLTKPTAFSFLADRLMDNKHHLSHVLSAVKVLVHGNGTLSLY